mmetsp:Transcript_462/g.1694  ORF Transcript_462/g.1694 Transcript_462/m.1694 type:complete len:352 (+) Transcript_462:415-1470(+)
MVERLLGREAPSRVGVQQSAQEILSGFTEVLRPVWKPELELSIHQRRGQNTRIVIKREASAEEDKNNDAQRPAVYRLGVGAALQHLGGQIPPGAEEARGVLAMHALAEAEVDQLEVVLGAAGGQQQVLRLEVPVDDVLRVHVGHGRDDLLGQALRLVLPELPARHDEVEELSAAHELHDNVQLGLGLDDLLQLDDVRVAQALEDVDLVVELRDQAAVLRLDLALVDDLHRQLLAAHDVHAAVARRRGADADGLLQFVLLDEGLAPPVAQPLQLAALDVHWLRGRLASAIARSLARGAVGRLVQLVARRVAVQSLVRRAAPAEQRGEAAAVPGHAGWSPRARRGSGWGGAGW